ncbi:MAG: hypothetical protein DBX39_01195 [Bacillota bacterium]|nr:MAG: hypothetical protein DBX39_01195 [Bacillota bacterium]
MLLPHFFSLRHKCPRGLFFGGGSFCKRAGNLARRAAFVLTVPAGIRFIGAGGVRGLAFGRGKIFRYSP